MVCATVNPSLRAASCWSVEVVNGGAGVFLAGLTLMALTEKSAFLQSSRNFCAAFSSVSRLLSSVRRVAPEGVVNMAVTRKYSSDRKFFYLLLALHYEPYGHRLYASGRKGGLDFFPQYGAKLESHYAVEHAARLLGVDAVYVDAPRVGYGVEYGVFCYFVEHYATRVVGVESEHFIEVPGYGFSLAVFIGSQPDRLGLCRGFP